MSITRSRVNIVLLTGLCAGLPLAGCGRGDSPEVALRRAHTRIQNMAPGRQGAPTPERNTAAYNEVLTAAGQVKGSDVQNASAALLAARAKAGLAQPLAQEAAHLEEDNQRDYQTLRSLLSQYITAAAQAQAIASYNPEAERAQIQKESGERDTELKAAQQRKAEADQRIAQLRGQASGKAEEARALRAQAAELKGKMGAVSAVQAEAMIKEARELGRRADGLEVEAATLDAQASHGAPLAQHMQIDIDRITTQKQILARAAEGVAKRDQDARAQSKQYFDAAAKIAGDIRAVVNQIDARRAGDQARAMDEAIAKHSGAVADASRVARALGGAAAVSLGGLQQTQGDLYWAKAQDAQSYATVLDSLAEAKPALPESGGYKAAADKARADAKEALDQATEAYKAANDSYQGAGGDADVQSRIATLNDLLARNVKATSGGSVDIKVAPEAAPAAEGGEAAATPAAPAGDDTTPGGTLALIKAAQATGDSGAALTYVYFPDDDNGRAFKAFIEKVTPSMTRLEKAVRAKFGDEAVNGLANDPSMKGNPMSADFAGVDPAAVQFDIQGETATATGPDGKTITMRQADGHWKLDMMASMGPQAAGMIPMLGMLADPMTQAADEVTADVEAGKYPDAKAAMTALGQKMGQAMMPRGGNP